VPPVGKEKGIDISKGQYRFFYFLFAIKNRKVEKE